MYKRWYDKYPELKQLLMLLEKVDANYTEIIAQDFIQIIAEKYKDEFDDAIRKMAEDPPPKYNRWYDANYDLHTCIEFIRKLDDKEKPELINTLIMSLYSLITNVDDE